MERALAALPEQDRCVVELRFLHDLEYREIAHVLGTSALACRLRVHRALGRLRQRLGPNATMRVAALPMLGLPTSVRSLAEGIAGAHVATSAVAGGALLMGAGTKAVLAAVVVAGGIGLWYAWPEIAPARRAAPAESAAETLDRPSLVGREREVRRSPPRPPRTRPWRVRKPRARAGRRSTHRSRRGRAACRGA